MKVFYPAYYHKFKCLAGSCPDSCCKDWIVDLDDDTAEYYRTLPGSLGDRLRQVMKTENGSTCLEIENGRCPMWRTDGLCRIQAQLDHDALCKTCREFPRLRHDYGDFAELQLELSCPEAARLILSPENQEIRTEDVAEDFVPDYDEGMMAILLHSRKTALALLDNPDFSVPQALAALLLYAYDVQSEIDGGESIAPDFSANLRQAEKFAKEGEITLFLDFFKDLEILTPRWLARLQSPAAGVWSDEFRLLAKYFVQRWWLQAVSDYDLICRVKLVISGCLVVYILGGNFAQTAQQFSKEIENDPDNVETLLSGAYTSPALTDLNLLGLLLK